MTMKEYVGYLLAALILLFHVFCSTLSVRLDWISFQKNYQETQGTIIQAVQELNKATQELNKRIGVLEEEKKAAAVEKK